MAQIRLCAPILSGSITIGRFGFPIHRLAVIIIGAALCVGLWWLQEKTKIGAIIRAGMDDAEMVSGLGINLTPINIGAFCLGAFLAGFAGVVGAPVLGGVNLNTGTDIFFVAIAVCIVGGVGFGAGGSGRCSSDRYYHDFGFNLLPSVGDVCDVYPDGPYFNI